MRGHANEPLVTNEPLLTQKKKDIPRSKKETSLPICQLFLQSSEPVSVV